MGIIEGIAFAIATIGIYGPPTAAALAAATFLVNAVVTAALVVGSTALARSLQPDAIGNTGGNTLATLNSPGVKASVKQSTPFQRIVRGKQRFGGAFAFYKAKPGKLYVQHMYSRRKLNRIIAVNVNGQRIVFGNPAFGTILAPLDVIGQPDYPNRMRCCFQAGAIDQPINPLLAEAFPDLADEELSGEWRLPGIANGVYEFEYGDDYDEYVELWGNTKIPDVEVEAEGCPVYDPRDPTQWLPRDPTDIYEWFAAQESWKYTENAALHAADELWQADGMNAGADAINWEKVAEAADRCDEVAATRELDNNGNHIYEKRYTCGGVVSLDQKGVEVFDGLLTAFRGTMVQGNDGTVWVNSDAPKKPVFTIRDEHLIGAVAYRGFKSQRELANKTVMRFVAPGRKYQQSEGPTLIRADLVDEDGQELPLNVNLPFTPSPSTAQRIAKADLGEARIERSWQGVLNLQALGIREDDCVEIASDICPHWNGLYTVEKYNVAISLQGNSGIAVQLTGYDPAICNDWNAAQDDQPHELIETDELLAA
jgi:hypothetical protein